LVPAYRYVLRKTFIGLRVYFAVVALLGLILLATVAGEDVAMRTVGWTMLVVAPVAAALYPRFVISRCLRQQAAPHNEPAVIELTDRELRYTSRLHSNELSWGAVLHVVELPEMWLAMIAPKQFIAVPSLGMDDRDRAEFAAFVRAGIHATDQNVGVPGPIRPVRPDQGQ
jgi:hypothetical protein